MRTRVNKNNLRDSKPLSARSDAASQAASARNPQPNDLISAKVIKAAACKTPVQLCEECAAAERESAEFDLKTLKFLIGKTYLFNRPFFQNGSDTNGTSKQFVSKKERKICDHLNRGTKYRDIMALFRLCESRDVLLYLIAWWLKQESICEPEKILGIPAVRKMANNIVPFLSQTAFRHAKCVESWRPYFLRLLEDQNQRDRTQLIRIGYDEEAIAAARKKRSATEAACDWLAGRMDLDAGTLRNAYSKVYGRVSFFSERNITEDKEQTRVS